MESVPTIENVYFFAIYKFEVGSKLDKRLRVYLWF